MMTLFLTEKAEQDLANIVDYTIDNWGYNQALTYNGYFDDAFQAITENPYLPISKSRENLLSNLRSLRVEKHYLFYIATDNEVTVIRILHEAMDFIRHLKG